MRLRRFAFAGALAGGVAVIVALMLAGPGAGAAVTPDRWRPTRHPSPTPTRPSPSPSQSHTPSPTPTPTSSGGPNRAQILSTMASVDGYWIAQGTDQASNNWLNAAFNTGHLAYVRTAGLTDTYSLQWATNNHFALTNDSRGEFFPDPYASGDVYLDIQAYHPDPNNLTALRSRVADEVASVQSGHTSYWN